MIAASIVHRVWEGEGKFPYCSLCWLKAVDLTRVLEDEEVSYRLDQKVRELSW